MRGTLGWWRAHAGHRRANLARLPAGRAGGLLPAAAAEIAAMAGDIVPPERRLTAGT